MRRLSALLLAAFAGVLLPLALVAGPAHAFVDASKVKRIQVVAGTVNKVGTKTAPARMILSRHPLGMALNAAVFGTALWASTDQGATVLAGLWDKMTGANNADPKLDPASAPAGADPGTLPAYQFSPNCTHTAGGVSWGGSVPGAGATISLTMSAVGQYCGEPGVNSGNYQVYCKNTVGDAARPDSLAHQAGYVKQGQSGTGIKAGAFTITNACNGIDANLQAVPVKLVFPGATTNGWLTSPRVFVNPDVPVNIESQAVVSNVVICRSNTGTQQQTVTSNGAPGAGWAPMPQCPTGYHALTRQQFLGAQQGDRRLLSELSVDPAAASQYQKCLGATAVGCDLRVEIDGELCTHTSTVCTNWWAIKDTARVRCLWQPVDGSAPYALPATDCGQLRHAYVTEHGAVADPLRQPDAFPVPAKTPVGDPWPVADPYPGRDPVTDPGVVQPTPTPSPSSTTGPTTGPSSSPSTGPTTGPTTGPSSGPGPGAGPATNPCTQTSVSTGPGEAGLRSLGQQLGANPITPHTDPQGNPALDLISSGDTNSAIAEAIRVDHAKYGARYVISHMRIASERSGWEWRAYQPITDQGDWEHKSHVHVSYGLPPAGTEAEAAATSTSVCVPQTAPADAPAGCLAAAVSWNPVDWVFVPVKCALTWAFKPTPGKLTATADAISTAIGAPVKPWSDSLTSYSSAFNTTANPGCKGPALALGAPLNITVYLLDACEYPKSTLATISRLGFGAVLIASGLWSCIRLISAGFGFQVTNGQGS